jgi:hypothetical protein
MPSFAFSEILLGLPEIVAVSGVGSAILYNAHKMGESIFSVILWVREPINQSIRLNFG